ncbi:MAG: hypothetical protein HRT41_03180 [Campylobacteraceae bacterium]|nr:hypothetical protein [Campylobacteraceae bacterium]
METIKISDLLRQLDMWKDDLKVYLKVFLEHKDWNNVEEVNKLQTILDEFLTVYANLEDEKKKIYFYHAVKQWSKTNKEYMHLLEKLYLAYKAKK